MVGILLGVITGRQTSFLDRWVTVGAKAACPASEWNESVRKIQFVIWFYGSKKILGLP
jgi:hypothetical protein